MKMKKLLALLLATTMAVSLLAGCANNNQNEGDGGSGTPSNGGENTSNTDDTADNTQDNTPDVTHSTDPMEMILEGRYAYSFSAEGYGDFVSFFHFYPADPVLGAVFYIGYLNNQTLFTGTYEVIKEARDYYAAPSRDGVGESGTADYTIVFYDWSGNELDRVAYDGDIIYNDMETLTAYGADKEFYYHDLDITGSQYASAYDMEMGVAYLDFIVEGDEYSGVTLNHNMTYVDLTGSIVEGTWTLQPNDQGGYDYTLTPNDSTDTGAVVSVAADKMTATYTADGSSETLNLVSTASTLTVIAQYDGSFEAYGEECPLSLVLYDDGTCELFAEVFGNKGVIDSGTYESVDAGCLLHMDKGGDLEAALTVHYVGSTDVGDVDTELTLSSDAPATEKTVLSQYDGSCEAYGTDCPLSLVIYDDGTCELFADVWGNVGVVDSGTYETVDEGALLHMEKAGDMVAGYTVRYVGTNDIGDVDAELTLVM